MLNNKENYAREILFLRHLRLIAFRSVDPDLTRDFKICKCENKKTNVYTLWNRVNLECIDE